MRRGVFILCLLFWLCTLGVYAEVLVPKAPLKKFYVPRFGEHGFKIMDFKGDEAEYLDEVKVFVKNMQIAFYGGLEDLFLDKIIKSKEGVFLLDKGIAWSDAEVELSSKNYTLKGEGWIWDSKEKRLVLKNRVRAHFKKLGL